MEVATGISVSDLLQQSSRLTWPCFHGGVYHGFVPPAATADSLAQKKAVT